MIYFNCEVVKMAKKGAADETKNFYIEQIKITKKIITTFCNNKEFSPAMLLNSLLSLVILPYEDAKKRDRSRIFDGKLQEIEKDLGITPVFFLPVKSCGDKIEYNKRTVKLFVNKFRNGIAHQNLEIAVGENREVLITIYNKYSCQACRKCSQRICTEKGLTYQSGGVIDFKITVSVTQLQRLALYIANSYLKAIEGGRSSQS